MRAFTLSYIPKLIAAQDSNHWVRTIKRRSKSCLSFPRFSGPDVSLHRHPGWDADSWGYHSDDGRTFSFGGYSSYGPTFWSRLCALACLLY